MIAMPNTESAKSLLITPKQAAASLSISQRKLFDLTKSGEIPSIRLGRRNVRYSPAALEQYVLSRPSAAS